MSFVLGFLLGLGIGIVASAIWHLSSDLASYER